MSMGIRRPSLHRRVARLLAVAAAAGAFAAGSPPSEAAVENVIYNPGNGHFYKFVSGTGTWGSAKSGAENLSGGYLCSLTSSQELQWVIANVGTGGNSVWIGGHDSVSEGNWQWLSGEAWSYTNWNGGEPNNSGGEHRLMMYASGTWNDANDVYTLPGYIVEWNADPNPPPPPVIPADPTNLTAAVTGQGTIQLGWTDNSTNETSFQVERKVADGAFVPFVSRNANSTSHEDDAIVPSTLYTYRVRAVNGVGPSNWSNEASATSSPFAPAPASPSDVAATPTGPHEVDVTWTDNSTGEVSFEVHRSSGSGPFAYRATLPADATSFHDSGLHADAGYAWSVRAVGTLRVSGFVQAGTATPPTLVVATTRGDIKDTPKPGKDSFKATGSWTHLEGTSDGEADPVLEGFTLRATTGDAVVTMQLPANAPGWLFKRGKWTWKSAKGSTPKYQFQVDPVLGALAASVKGIDFGGVPAASVRISLAIGDDGGTDVREWTPKRKAGVFLLR
jgi:hypothetical protein